MTIVSRAIAAAVLGSLAVATAVPALATEKLPAPAYKARYDAKRDKFCLRATGPDARRTGTHIIMAECKTQAQWAADGLRVARN